MRKKEITGLILLAMGAGGIYLSIQSSTPQYVYLTAKHDIAPGDFVSNSDFKGTSLYLADQGKHYLSADAKFTSHQSLRRINAGEVAPRDAIALSQGLDERKLFTFTVDAKQIPAGLSTGDLIDIHFLTSTENTAIEQTVQWKTVFEKMRIRRIEKSSVQLDGRIQVGILVNPDKIKELVLLASECSIVLVQRFDDGI